MIRAALAALALSGCTFVEHVQLLPVVNPTTDDASCCVAFFELSSSTSGSIEVHKSPVAWSVSAKVHHQF